MLSDAPLLSREVYSFPTSRGTSEAIRGDMRDVNEGAGADSCPSGGWTTGSGCWAWLIFPKTVIGWPDQPPPTRHLLSRCSLGSLISSSVGDLKGCYYVLPSSDLDEEIQTACSITADCCGKQSTISLILAKCKVIAYLPNTFWLWQDCVSSRKGGRQKKSWHLTLKSHFAIPQVSWPSDLINLSCAVTSKTSFWWLVEILAASRMQASIWKWKDMQQRGQFPMPLTSV